MRQRVEGVAGTLEIESEPDGGTAISARWPPSRGDRVNAPIRVMIVDDDPVVRNGLIGMFEPEAGFEVVGDAGDGAEAVRRAEALAPDVILMDLRMPEIDGVTAIAALAAAGSPARVLVLTTYDTDSDVLSAIEAGATGYLLKERAAGRSLRAVRSAASGEAVCRRRWRPGSSADEGRVGPFRRRRRSRVRLVSSRFWRLLARGASNRDAAARLFISEATVRPT